MPEQAKKLTHFIDTVVQEATDEADRDLRALEEQKAAALVYADRAAKQEALRQIRAESARIRAEAGKEVSRHLMECKREVYLRRTQIAAQVFGQVEERIRAFTASPDYPARLEERLKQAVERFGMPFSVTVSLREADMALAPALEKAAAPVKVDFKTGDFALGGLVVDCPERGLRADGSYDAALTELSGRFAELFGLTLAEDLSDMGKDEPQ